MSEQQINENSVEVTSVEESPTTTATTTSYPMDMDTFDIKINIFPTLSKPQYVTHSLSKPTFDQEEARERKMPLITKDAGKVEGGNASTTTMDDEPANVALYDKIIKGVKGYILKKGEKSTDTVTSPDEKITTRDGEFTVKELIPLGHKSTAISGMYLNSFDMDVEDEEFAFALGAGREWRMKQEIGGKSKREDGTLAPADYNVYYTFREPTESERKDFRNKAIIALNVSTKGGSVDRRSVNLRIVRDLFDKLIIDVENATVDGSPLDVHNASHLEHVPGTFKKGAILKLFNFLEADLGN